MGEILLIAEHNYPHLFVSYIFLVGATTDTLVCFELRWDRWLEQPGSIVCLSLKPVVPIMAVLTDFLYCENPNWEDSGVNSPTTQLLGADTFYFTVVPLRVTIAGLKASMTARSSSIHLSSLGSTECPSSWYLPVQNFARLPLLGHPSVTIPLTVVLIHCFSSLPHCELCPP